jgi:hypothetical protein
MSLFPILPKVSLWVRKLKWPNFTFPLDNVGFDPRAFSGFNINMKPNEAQREENQGFRGEKIPPPVSENCPFHITLAALSP